MREQNGNQHLNLRQPFLSFTYWKQLLGPQFRYQIRADNEGCSEFHEQ